MNKIRLQDPGPFCDAAGLGVPCPRISADLVARHYQIPLYDALYLVHLHKALIDPQVPKNPTNRDLAKKIGRSVAQLKRALERLQDLNMISRSFIRYIIPHRRGKKWIPWYTSRTLTTVLSLPKRPHRSPTRSEWWNASQKLSKGANIEFNFGVNVARNLDGDGLDWATVPFQDGSPGFRRLFPMGPEVQRFMGHLPSPDGRVVWV